MDRLQAGDPGQIGPFRLLGRLGEGGMGRVFLGASPGGRKVAIKVVHPHHANDPEFRWRFSREVAAARQVGGFHTALVVDAAPDADPPWMATAYIPGPSVAEAVARQGPLGEARVRDLGAALAEGLAAIHACGLIHRDLKPSNVILADDGPRIIDFGIAKGADATALTGSNAVIGTLRYMSPEQLNGHEITAQSDVFALGTILAYAATGHDPFEAPTIPAVITRIISGPPSLDPLTGDLRDIISACLAKDPSDRPSPGDLLARFNLLEAPRDPAFKSEPEYPATQQPSQDSTVNVGQAVPKPQRRNRRPAVLIASGTAVAIGFAAFGFFLTDNSPTSPPSATATHPPASPSAKSSNSAAVPSATSTPSSTGPAATSPVPLLGESRAITQGYGSVRPSTVDNGGDPTGTVTDLSWQSWGGAKAVGSGMSYYDPPNVPVSQATKEPATVVAFDLGTCDGRYIYQAIEWYFPESGGSFSPTSYLNICSWTFQRPAGA